MDAVKKTNVTKKEIAGTIAEKTGITQVDTSIVMEEFFKMVREVLKQGKNIEIRGFGRFKTRQMNGRMARNPRTGEPVQMKPFIKPVFEVSKELKMFVNEI